MVIDLNIFSGGPSIVWFFGRILSSPGPVMAGLSGKDGLDDFPYAFAGKGRRRNSCTGIR